MKITKIIKNTVILGTVALAAGYVVYSLMEDKRIDELDKKMEEEDLEMLDLDILNEDD